ncbi:hypothetical protein FRC07_006279 [Ceratobasidium sp. 392]|nr:hypothetical protein FRC07_006279 [Ceratobasidium sp. 392]
MSPPIPTLRFDDPAHAQAYHHLQELMSQARRVTVVCGAGISTSAGIPDYRSPSGLYNCPPSELGTAVLAKDLFDIRNLHNDTTLAPVGRFMAKLRIDARNSTATEGHFYIKLLDQLKRLLCCYYLNVDGIFTRGPVDISGRVVELHGRNELRCHKCHLPPEGDLDELDERLLSEGIATCSRSQCVSRGQGQPAAGPWLRQLPPGLLLPDIVWNQDSRDHGIGDSSFERLQELNGRADLLLLIGTSLGTHGVGKLVRSLARTVHSGKGAVVYLGKGGPLAAIWVGYIDLQVECDVDTWAKTAARLIQSNAATKVRNLGTAVSDLFRTAWVEADRYLRWQR